MSDNLKGNIPVHELTLENGEVVVFYDFLTTGESRELQKILLEKGKFNSQTNQIEDLPLTVFLESQDKAASFVVKEIKANSEVKPFSVEWLSSLPVELGNLIYEEVNRLTQLSQLSSDKKKV